MHSTSVVSAGLCHSFIFIAVLALPESYYMIILILNPPTQS